MDDGQLGLFGGAEAAGQPRVAAGRPDPAPFAAWADTAARIGAERSRRAKVAILAAYVRALSDDGAATAVRWFAGQGPTGREARALMIGRSATWPAIASLAGVPEAQVAERRVALGSTAAVAAELLVGRAGEGLTLGDVQWALDGVAEARRPDERRARVAALLTAASGAEASWLIALLGGGLRIGLLAAQVEEAIAAATDAPLAAVRDAVALAGDLGAVLRRARAGTLAATPFTVGRPLGFMLAQPLATAHAVAAALPVPCALEAKYDGIRAQLHVGPDGVRLFSRTRDDITAAFPDLLAGARTLAPGCVLDGELVAVSPDDPVRVAPFRVLQTRLGRRAPTLAVRRDVPVAFIAFDLLARDGARWLDRPWRERRAALEAVVGPDPAAPVRRAPVTWGADADAVREAFDAARAAGHEGLIAKDPASSYEAGRRGGRWIKLKTTAATLDVVVTAAERGNGRRAALLSDVTFAVRASERDDTLLDVGKAYSGLTDAELAALTTTLEGLVRERRGGWHRVEPAVVLEVTFDLVQPSDRHASGYALRFPRIVRWRTDKPVAEIDTLARVRALAGEASAPDTGPSAARGVVPEEDAGDRGPGVGELRGPAPERGDRGAPPHRDEDRQ